MPAPRIRNPFRYGKPVPPDRFIGRAEEVQTLFDRVHNGESTAIIGDPHMGKSSLLRFMAHPATRQEQFGDDQQRHLFVDFDVHLLANDDTPAEFWRQVMLRLEAEAPASIQGLLERLREKEFDSFALEQFFEALGEQDIQLVLLIDEVDALLHHPNFSDTNFFGNLRSLASRTDGLCLVLASRLSVSELNRLTSDQRFGSPFFNTHTELELPVLRQRRDVDALLNRNLEGTEVHFSLKDRAFLDRVAGRHPYLIQAAAAALFDAVSRGGDHPAERRYEAAAATLTQRSGAYFDDLWRHLSPATQTAMVILALAEAQGHAQGRDFDTGALADMGRYRPELDRLRRLGWVETLGGEGWHADWGNFALWHGERWRITPGAFVWWILHWPVAGTRRILPFDQWLENQEFEGLMTRSEKAQVKEALSQAPGALKTASEMVGTLLKGFTGL